MGKRYLELVKKIDKTKLHSPEEALHLVKETSNAKFDEAVDIAVRLGIDPKKSDQQVRGTVVLPHGTGKKVKVAVFAQGEKAKEAEEAGADMVGGAELIEKIKSGFLDFEATVATPDMMGQVGKIGKILGPRGLMPNPKTGTVTFDIARAVSEIKAGKVEFKIDKQGIIHTTIGKIKFDTEILLENLIVLTSAIMRAKPPTAKGQYLKSIVISSTMGPGIKIDPQKLQALVAKSA